MSCEPTSRRALLELISSSLSLQLEQADRLIGSQLGGAAALHGRTNTLKVVIPSADPSGVAGSTPVVVSGS